jgi:hypothetical protein
MRRRLALGALLTALLLIAPAGVSAGRAASPLPLPPLPPLPSILPTATGSDPVQTGMWFLLEPPGGIVPAPPTVPADGLWVASLPVGPIAMSAVRFQMKPNESEPILTLNFASLTTLPVTPLGTGGFPIVACPITSAWTPTNGVPGTWSSRPTYDCSKGLIAGSVSPDKTKLIFDLTTITSPGQLVNLALIPGTVANSLIGIIPITLPSLPALPSLPDGLVIPNPLAAQGPSTFESSFGQVTPKALNFVISLLTPSPPTNTASSGTSDSSTAGATDSGSSNSQSLADGPALSSPAPALDQPTTSPSSAASTQQPAATPLTTTPAGTIQPTSNTTGRRILAGLLLVALAYWAFELLVRKERTATAPVEAEQTLTIGSWMQGSVTTRNGQPPSIS